MFSMFYFIRKEGNVLFNDTLDNIYVGYMASAYGYGADNEREETHSAHEIEGCMVL